MEAYEIRVKGHLSGKTLALFADLTATLLPMGETLLTGVIPDQAALHGILRRIHSLGIVLVQVQQIDRSQQVESE